MNAGPTFTKIHHKKNLYLPLHKLDASPSKSQPFHVIKRYKEAGSESF